MNPFTHWTTKREKEYINTIGTWKVFSWRPQPENFRLICLKGYRDAFHLRKDWGEINREEIFSHLNKVLVKNGIDPLL